MARAPAVAPGEPVDDPRQLAAQFDLIQRQLQSVDRRLAQLEQALVEAQQAASTVQALAEATATQEALLPLGSGVHVRATVDPQAPVLLPIGAGYYTEGPANGVTGALQERVASITQAFQQASAEAERLAQTAAAINEHLNSLSP